MFKVGDKVKYVSGRYGDARANPLWNGQLGQVIGEIDEILDEDYILVKWDKYITNSYSSRDLEKVNIINNDIQFYIQNL
ncbi:MAG: hypothetical protein RBT05_03545 [Bacteroidales bacterium]|jgi:hypothetical protein|nr:hypothetical protein [Bacteroidales bacterium]